MNESAAASTPMLRQYQAIKADHQDAILFFRLGDFYEMFFDDATVAAKALSLTLTGRGKDENRVPMCGIPHHASESYITKLIQQGFKVAVCEQVEAPNEAKGITRREVVQVITPGTVMQDSVLSAQENNYLAAICVSASADKVGVAYVDISTGEFRLGVFKGLDSAKSHLNRLQIKEILLPNHHLDWADMSVLQSQYPSLSKDRAIEELCAHFKVQDLGSFGVTEQLMAAPAAWAIMQYLIQTQKHQLPQIRRLMAIQQAGRLKIDPVSIRNLELVQRQQDQNKKGSLFWVLNHTKTAMGARYLNQLLRQPLTQVSEINQRLDAVAALKGDLLTREEIREVLKQVYDLERLVARIVSDRHNPKDCLALKQSLQALTELPHILDQVNDPYLNACGQACQALSDPSGPLAQLRDTLERAIEDEAPSSVRQVGIIKPGFSVELDELVQSFSDIKAWIQGLEAKERERSGINGLKVGYNKVFGYYFQISNTQVDKVPEEYIRKQTLTNAERYITPELKEKETILLNGEDKQQQLEYELYLSVVEVIKGCLPLLSQLAEALAQLDVVQSLANVAQKNQYCRPQLVAAEQQVLSLKGSRHPVLEQQGGHTVVPNDIHMDASSQVMLITGPNMAGKSTLMRQVAVSMVMAQIGSFIPASEAKISVIDALYTRIGAMDNLFSGQSTFMVEMIETAMILNEASSHSFILLDEIGRGTSTYDGMSIAAAVTSDIHDRIKAKCMFATHYHELTQLNDRLPRLVNHHMGIREDATGISFTYECLPGPADKSYGIHVAKMAGLPMGVLKEAEEILNCVEAQANAGLPNGMTQLQLFTTQSDSA